MSAHHEATPKDTKLFSPKKCRFVSLCLRGGRLSRRGCGTGQRAQQPTFRSGTRLIVQTVTVKDKDGKPIEGLTARDFVVTEDGEPQAIAFVEFQRLENTPVPAAGAGRTACDSAVRRPAASAERSGSHAAAARISSSPAGDIRYRNRRLLVLYFDMTALPPPDLTRAYAAALKFVNEQMESPDLVAIMGFEGGAVKVKQDFTDNRALLAGGDRQAGVRRRSGRRWDPRQRRRHRHRLRTGRCRVQHPEYRPSAVGPPDRGDDAAGAAGSEIARLLRQRPAPERRRQPGAACAPPPTRPFARTCRSIPSTRAASSRPRRSATRPVRSPGGIGMFSGRLADATMGNFQRSQDTLYSLAKDTGGKALFDYNDLSMGIVQAAQAVTSYYIVGYYSTHAALDGKFHRVRVSLRDGLTRRVVVSTGLLCRQGVREVHDRRQGASARRGVDARQPGDRDHDRDGSELLPVESRRVLRAGRGEDSRQRAGAGKTRRRTAHAHRLHRRGEGRLRRSRSRTCATSWTSS